MAIPRELLRAVKAHRVVPFVGAGVSMGVKQGLFPSWWKLLDDLAQAIAADGDADTAQQVLKLRDGDDYLLAAEVACKRLGPFVFNRELRAALRVPLPDGADLSVPAGIWGLQPPLVITTNYDEVLTWAGPKTLAVVADDQPEELALLADRTSESPWVWHLHGTIQRLGTVILAGSDYKRLYEEGDARGKAYENALFRLRAVLVDHPLLYVGFSLKDPYVIQQIQHVLDLTDRKGPPSYALMKKGEGDAAGLWSNYNIQLVEYEAHGPPLAALLAEIARQAFPEARPVAAPPVAAPPVARTPSSWSFLSGAPAGVPMGPVSLEAMRAPATRSVAFAATAPPERIEAVPRPVLEDEIMEALRDHRRVLLLGPRRGGARTLARGLAARHFGQRATWLSPPIVPGCAAADYFRALADDPRVTSAVALESWLHARAGASGGEHLLVLKHDGGPREHLKALGRSLGKLLDEGRAPFFALVVGGAACARLRSEDGGPSLFNGAFVQHAPPLTVGEVRAALLRAGLDGGKAAEVHAATGGLPGLVNEVIHGGVLDGAALVKRLAESPAVQGVLRLRLSEDDREGVAEELHARHALREMLAGREVRRLGEVGDRVQFAEARLYYDGLVVADEATGGATVFRCEAVRVAAEAALRTQGLP